MKKVVSTCIYCGCGCKLTYWVKGDKIAKITGFNGDDISDGKPCIKGLTINEVFNKNRIRYPMVRKSNKLVKSSWQEAIDAIHKKVKSVKPGQIFLNGSGKITNEDNLLIYKIGWCLFNTANIDSCCGRLCHISTVRGVKDCLGASNLTRISNLDKLDCLFIIGSNPAVNYPVFWDKVLKRRKRIKIISTQSLLNLTSKFGDIFLEIEPGTEISLLNGIINYLIQNNAFVKDAKSLPNFQRLVKLTSKYNLKYVSKTCEIPERILLKAYQTIASSKNLGVFHGMGFTQHENSLENIHSLLNILILKDADIMTLRGEINVQGVGDVLSAETKILSKLWNTKVEKPNGNMIKSLLLNPVKMAFLVEFNPAQSMPNLNKVHKKLEEIFIVYLGSYFNLTTEYADVILPIPSLFESYGTITNGEQRLRLVNKPLQSKFDLLQIAKLLAKKFGKENFFQYKDIKQLTEEMVKAVPEYRKLKVSDLYKGIDGFAEQKIKYRRFFPERYPGKETRPSGKFPFILTTFREMHQFLTSEITEQSPTLRKLDKDRLHVFINPEDAKKLKIKDEDKIRLTSCVGSINALARVSDKVPTELVATRYHYKEMLVNKLFPPVFDDVTFTPCYKCCAVRVKKV